MSSTSRFAVTVSTLESIGLVLIGVLAGQLHNVWAILGLVVIATTIGLGKYLAAAPTRTQAARDWLVAYLEDPVDLEGVLREIASHIKGNTWSRTELVQAIDWWVNEDLFNEYQMELDILEGQRRARRASRGQRIKLVFRHPIGTLRGWVYRIERSAGVAAELSLLRVVARLPEREVARIISTAGVKAGFLEQAFLANDRGYVSLSHKLLLPPRFGEN